MTQRQLVNIVLAAFLIWAVLITGVTFYYAKANHAEELIREANKTCRNIAHRIVPCTE